MNKQARYYNHHGKKEEFGEGDLVWVRSYPLSQVDSGFAAKLDWTFPFFSKIIKPLNPVNYQVSYLSIPSQVDTVHVEHLKWYYGQAYVSYKLQSPWTAIGLMVSQPCKHQPAAS
ncbi:hypothetical protein MHYP_G00112550 [Metynnis hypsauchen]